MAIFEDSPDYWYFVDTVKRLSNIDLRSYKPWQIQRRLAFIMDQAGAKGYRQYADMLTSDNDRLLKFVDWVTINVSEFYRDPLKFQELKGNVLPGLLKNRKHLRIWSAGCSNGSEPYTIALMLEDLTPGVRHTIIATDIDDRILITAKEGIYLERDIRNVPKHLFTKYFTQNGGQVTLSNEIKQRVEFRKNDLLKDSFETDFDLILCRNVVIYFTNEAKDNIYRKFWSSLNDHGILFVGGAESILNSSSLGFKVILPFFYGKVPSAGVTNVKEAS